MKFTIDEIAIALLALAVVLVLGGLVTAISLPLIAAFGAVTMGIVAVMITLLFIAVGVVLGNRARALEVN
jgi:hypothetical protein